jgi:hypothetical protein
MFIAPPWIPYAPGLARFGLAVERLLLVEPRPTVEVLWAMEEGLRSGTCASVIAWFDPASADRLRRSSLQRLHLLASRQSTLAVLVRGSHCRAERSPARLRLQLTPSAGELQLEIFRNGWRAAQQVHLEKTF